jgi:hypothetical protein
LEGGKADTVCRLIFSAEVLGFFFFYFARPLGGLGCPWNNSEKLVGAYSYSALRRKKLLLNFKLKICIIINMERGDRRLGNAATVKSIVICSLTLNTDPRGCARLRGATIDLLRGPAEGGGMRAAAEGRMHPNYVVIKQTAKPNMNMKHI